MASVLLSGAPAVAAKATEYQQQEFDPNQSMNSNEDLALAEAIFGDASDVLGRQTAQDASKQRLMSERPDGKAVQISAHEAEQAADPAHAMDSDAQEPSNTAVEKYSDSLQNLADLSNAAEFADHENNHGATSTHVHQPASPARPTKARCVLVAKCLTNSDASSGRIILPRVAVEANLPFVTAYRHYALAVRDSTGRRYEFVIKSWANGTEHRRVFVLEQAGEFLRAHNIGVGDTVGICTDEYGELVVEANTEEVKYATVCPRYGHSALAMPAPPRGATAAATSAVPLAAVMAGRCARSVHCTKAAGHPGFCSGPKAAAAAAAAAAAQAQAAGAAAVARFRRKTHTTAPVHTNHANMVVPAMESSEAFAPHAGEDAGAYSSDETAVTHIAGGGGAGANNSFHHNSIVIATQKGEHSLPEGLHTIAYIPAGLRISKTLTAYDISSKRIILPAEDLEDGVPNCGDVDVFTLAAVDESQRWQFPTLRAWHTVAGRRGYLLEAADEFLSSRAVVAGDTLVVYRDADMTPPRIEVRAGTGGGVEARRHTAPATIENGATEEQGHKKAITFSELPMLLHPEGGRHHSHHHQQQHTASGGFVRGETATPRSSAGTHGMFRSTTTTGTATGQLSGGAGGGPGAMACNRTGGCTKSAGHQGFCSGHKGFKRREGTPTGAAGFGFRGGHPLRQHRVVPRNSSHYQQYTDEEEGSWGSDDDEYTPAYKRMKRGSTVSTPRAGDPLLSLLQLLDA